MNKNALLIPTLLILQACGGGGGGGTPPPSPSPPPAFTIAPTVTFSADAGIGANPTVSIDAIANVTLSDTQRAAFTMTANGLDHVYFSPRQNQTWDTIFYFKDPTVIGPGVYVDTVRVGLCTDVNCTALQTSTVSTVTITYTVTGTVPPPAAVQAASSSVSASAMAYTDERPRVTVPLTYLHQRANYSFSTTTSSAYLGALNSQVINATTTGAVLEIFFKPPSMLAPGVYDDVITVDVCAPCPTPVQGSPLRINTRYTITDTAAGSNGYRIRLLPHAAWEMAWDQNSQLLYLAVPASAAANGGSLIAVNPQTGALAGSVSAGMDPLQLSVAADGRFAYVASGNSNLVRRFNLPSLTPDINISLGVGSRGELAMRDMEVSPFDSTLLAIERQAGLNDGNRHDIALVVNGLIRPYAATDVIGRPLLDGLQWADATHLHGNADSNRAIGTLTIAGGEFASHSIAALTGTGSASDGRTHWDGTFYYRDNGEKVDVQGGRLAGRFALQDPGARLRALVPDAQVNRVFALVADGSIHRLQSFALDSMQPIASVPLAGVPFELVGVPQVIRFGSNGVAVNTRDGRVVLVEGAFVAP